MSNDAEKYLVTRDTGYLAKSSRRCATTTPSSSDLDSLPLTGGERRGARAARRWSGSRASQLASDLRARGPDAPLPWRDFSESLEPRAARNAIAGERRRKTRWAASSARPRQAEQEAEQVSRIAAAGALLLSILLSALLARSILEPLARLAEGTREVSAGRFDYRLTPTGNDELAQVARDFNSMTERLDELDRMKRDFVSKVSHDLKTPLSSMQETTAVMLDELPGPLTPKQRQLLEINQDSGQRLSAMITKLLDLSRIEAGLDAERQLIDVTSLLRRSVDYLVRGQRGDRVTLVGGESGRQVVLRRRSRR